MTTLLFKKNLIFRRWNRISYHTEMFKGFTENSEFRILSFLIIITIIAGTIFYNQAEGWNLLDSLYFSTITLTTVGYGDLVPVTDIGKIFTIVLK